MTGRKYFKSTNPYNLDPLGEYPEISDSELSRLVIDAECAFYSWRKGSLAQRAELLLRLEQVLLSNKIPYATLITQEMGKVIRESIAEIEKCARLCRYYADNIDNFISNVSIPTEAEYSYISYQPLGIILGIMPWNFPFWQALRFAIPAISAGNTVILKHASNVQGCAQALSFAFEQAGYPDFVYNNIPLSSHKISQLIADRRIKAVSLTGSEKAGRSVGALAGSYLKKSVLELGGSDAYLILDDADIDLAIDSCIKSRMINAGQSCIGAKRVIVDKSIYADFVEGMKAAIQDIHIGDPMDKHSSIGPLARKDIRDELHNQVIASTNHGALCLFGGYIPDTKGHFYPPSLLVNIHEKSPAYYDELFGPVISILIGDGEEEAIRLANDVNFGLGAAVFSKDVERAQYIAETQLNAGMCFVNGIVKSDPRLPFGGINDSGYGRELGADGLREFVNIKSIWIS